jgi:hypothetical protein
MSRLERLAFAAIFAPGVSPPLLYVIAVMLWPRSAHNAALNVSITLGLLLYLLALPAFVVIQLALQSRIRWLALPGAGALIPFPVVVLLWFAFGRSSAEEERMAWWSLVYAAPVMGMLSGLVFAMMAGAPRTSDAVTDTAEKR